MIKFSQIDNLKNLYLVTFSYQPLTAGKHEIFLAGDFNDFSPSRNKFKEENGIYSCTLELPKGKYCYKFVIDGNWLPDVDADEITADGYGGHNSVLYVGDPAEIKIYRLVSFKYPYAGNLTSVYIAGTFNNWLASRDQLLRNNQNEYEILIPLQPGKYYYRFIVNGKWITDPAASEQELNAFHQYDSIIQVDESLPDVSKYDKPGIITFGLSGHDIDHYCSVTSDKLRFRTNTYKNNCAEVSVIISDQKISLEKIDSNHCCDYYQTEIDKLSGEIQFIFHYQTESEELYMGRNGFWPTASATQPFVLNPDLIKPFETPRWVKEGIIYQIFPDRFNNGNPALNQNFTEWYYEGLTTPPERGKKLLHHQPFYHFVTDWYDHRGLQQSPYHEDGIPDHFSFYGGDLEGVRQKLDYLTDLGVTVLYLNPIFEARSNHKYDSADYRKVDPHFGSEADFKQLVSDCHKRGMKLIIDTAFNHTGDTFWAFRDAVKKGPDSNYYSWYEWKKWPLPAEADYNPSEYYNCWWGLGHMPDLDYDKSRFSPAENPVKAIADAKPNWEVVNYILETAEFWLREMDIDGFRLDVPNEVPFWFWELFRDKVKSLKPDAYIVGEIWHNAEEWIGPRYFDAVMNYACFKDPVIQFLNLRKGNASDFDKALKPGLLNYPQEATLAMMNLLDSHDTFRYLEIAQGDLNKLKLALIFQMTYVGTPHIWYGDEIAMRGAHDPDCRRPFNWRYANDPEKVALREFYKKLIRIRKDNPVLIYGDYKTIWVEAMVYAYSRKNPEHEILVALNNSNSSSVLKLNSSFEGKFTDLLSGKEHFTNKNKLLLKLASYSGAILLKENH